MIKKIPGPRPYRASAQGQVEDFYTSSAAQWWIEMLNTVAESRAVRKAR